MNTFQVVLGGDGAPFGKDDSSCSWLVSFLNRGKHILSSNENLLIFGSNCSENSLVMKRYVLRLLKDISEVDKKVFHIDGRDIKFEFSEFPNDLKMIAFLAGELSVSAKYFSTHGNVSTADYDNPLGTFGPGPGHTWKPWDYRNRVSVSKQVEKFKEKVDKQKCSDKQRERR